MNIEIISVENLKEVTALVLELWDECSFEEEFENYKNIIDSEKEICYVVRDYELYVAFIHLNIRNDYVEGAMDSPVAYVEGIYVKADYQKQGIAKTLIKAAEDWARQKGIKQLASDSAINNSASIDFHKKAGFIEVERIICFIKNL